jgi:hypothetical protein
MADLGPRLTLLLQTLVPFAFFMACVYLALHILVVRVVRRPDSPVLWFFAVVTGPLVRPLRALLPPGTPEPRVRAIALAAYATGWLGSGFLLRWLGRAMSG